LTKKNNKLKLNKSEESIATGLSVVGEDRLRGE